MVTEKIQDGENKEVSQNASSFDEIRQKVIKLNNEEYKGRTYKVGVRALGPVVYPYVGVKTEKVNQRGENINKDEKKGKSLVPSIGVGFGYGKIGKKERERLESDKQEMMQLISDLGELYGLDGLPDKDGLYVKEENGNIIIGYFEGKKSSGAETEENIENNEAVNTRDIIKIICNGEKAICRRNDKVETEIKQKTPEEIKAYKDFIKVRKDFNTIFDSLDEEIVYTNQSGIGCSISSIEGDYEKMISIIEGENNYNLSLMNDGNFRLLDREGKEVGDLSPEDVMKEMKYIREKINEGKTINAQSKDKQETEEHDEIQKNEKNQAELELDQALKDLE